MPEEKELRWRHVRGRLEPTDCECHLCRTNGKTGVLCKRRTWRPPPRLTLTKPPKNVADCLRQFKAADAAFDKVTEGPLQNVDIVQELTKMVLMQEALIIWLAEQIHKLPGQPNSMDHMMLCDVNELCKIHTIYSIEENQRKGLQMKEQFRKKYGWCDKPERDSGARERNPRTDKGA